MDAETLQIVINSATGAGGAVVICLLVMAAAYRLIVKELLPAHKETMQDFVRESKETRKIFQKSVDVMSERLTKVEDNLEDIGREISIIREKL